MSMSTGKRLFDEADSNNADGQREYALRVAVKAESKSVEGASYSMYTFKDGSEFTMGSNGFAGCKEVPEWPHQKS